jgi:hypothetical protein
MTMSNKRDPYEDKACLACLGVSAIACMVSLYVLARVVGGL